MKNECVDGEFVSVRLPAELAELYRVSNLQSKDGGKSVPNNPAAFSRRPEHEFFLPANLAALAKPVPPELSQGMTPPPVLGLPPLRTPRIPEQIQEIGA